MEYFPAPLEALVEQFARLPGIGGKTAQRLAFHVLSLPEEDAQAFADAIVTAKRTVTYCPVCRNFTAGGLCPICSSPKRDNSVICVVADPRDVAAMELGREFNVTRERVRQIEAKALRKLRHPSRAKRLRDYLDE